MTGLVDFGMYFTLVSGIVSLTIEFDAVGGGSGGLYTGVGTKEVL